MTTKMEIMSDYGNYIKCGEILKSPFNNFQIFFVLECSECEQIHLSMETFINDVVEHMKTNLSLEASAVIALDAIEGSKQIDDRSMNSETDDASEVEDHLVLIKHEADNENYESKDNEIHESNDNEIHEVNDDEIHEVYDFENHEANNDENLEANDYEVERNSEKQELLADSGSNTGDEFQLEDVESADVEEDPLVSIKLEADNEYYESNDGKNHQPNNDEIHEAGDDKNHEADDDKNHEYNDDDIHEANDDEVESSSEQQELLEDIESNTDDEFQLEDAESNDVELGNKTTKKRESTSAVVSAFIESKNNIRTLIKFYKNQPNLYTKNYPLYRFKDEKQASLEEITRDVNRELKLKLTWKETSQLINYLRRKHREEYRRLQHHKDKDNNKNYKYSWFFQDLNFLNPESVIKLNKIDSHLPELTNKQIVKLILIYEEHPHLWNSNLIEYVCSNKRHDSHMKMLKSLENNMNLRISKNTLEKYLRNIHSYFSQEKCFRTNFANNEAALKTRCDNFYKHLLYLFDHEGPYQCTECNKVFLKPFGFKVHMSGHTDLAPFVCSQCNKEFKNATSYTTHVKHHFEDYDVACPQCDKKFVSKRNLYIHSAVHSGERPYCCEICGASFRNRKCFRNHLIYHEKRYSHFCHICSKGYYSKERYNDHMNSHMNIRSHICTVCDKGFITRRALKEHVAIHVNVRNYACEVCGKKFKVKSGVSQHMKIHRSKIDIKDKIECFVQKST